MKKILKTTCAAVILATAVCPLTGLDNVASVNAEIPTLGSTYSTPTGEYLSQIKITGLKKVAQLGDNYALPTAKMAGTDPTDVKVSYNGKNIAINDNKVAIAYIGTYTINYAFNVSSVEYKASVTFRAEKAKLNLSDVATKIPLKLPANLTQAIKLPVPEVTDKDGETVTATVETIVTAPGLSNALPVNADNEIDFTTAKVDNKLILGNYYVKYVAKIGGVKLAESENYSIEVIDDYAVTDLRYEYSSSKPTTWELGEKKELPAVIGVDKISKTESETVNVSYAVKKIVYTKDGVDSDVTLADVLDGMKFTPNKIGTYTISYEVKDYIGNTSTYVDDLVIEVSDNTKPKIKVVEAYATDATTHTDALHRLPSKSAPENVIVMPVWAEDKGSATVADGLKLSILVEDRTSYSYVYQTTEHGDVVNKELVFNKAGDINADTQVDTGVDLQAGRTYRVYYRATDKYNNSFTEYYDIKIENDFAYDTAPEVEFTDVFPSSIQNGETLTFSAPTFSDDSDERLLTAVEYRYGTEEYQELEPETDGTYKLVVDTTLSSLSIRAKATNNGNLSSEDLKVIEVVDVSDNAAPVVTNNGAFAVAYTQGDEVTLPTIQVTDDKVEYVSISAKVEHIDQDNKSTEMATYDATTIRVGNEKHLVGTKTLAARKGNYRATFTVVDAGNNVIIQYFDYTVAENPALVDRRFTNLPVTISDGKLSLGKSATLPTPTIVKADGETASYYVSVKGPGGSAEIHNNKFTPYAEGTYTLKYVGKVVGGTDYPIESQEYTIVVSDTDAPTYHVDANVRAEVDKNTTFTIPMISVDDGEFGTGVDFENSYVTLSSNSTTQVKYTLTELYAETRTKSLNKEEEYSLKYYIVDKAGNSVQKTYTIAVGDTRNPTLELGEDILPTTVNKGDRVTIDLSKITVDDDKDTEINVTDDLVITLKNTTTNKTVTALADQGAGKYVYEIKNAGSYEFSFRVTDNAGHSTETTRTFVVDAESNDGTEKTEVIGTILIVVSILVLAGVIVYFIVSKKKNDRLYK